MVDPLSDILTLANAESVITGRLLAGVAPFPIAQGTLTVDTSR